MKGISAIILLLLSNVFMTLAWYGHLRFGEYKKLAGAEWPVYEVFVKKLFNGIKDMSSLPDVVIFTNQLKDSLAIQECLKLGIPTICIVDTNCNPDLVPYPIPANDDSSSSINFILNYLVNRILTGYNIKEKIENIQENN
jgi:ribosomal protein S2